MNSPSSSHNPIQWMSSTPFPPDPTRIHAHTHTHTHSTHSTRSTHSTQHIQPLRAPHTHQRRRLEHVPLVVAVDPLLQLLHAHRQKGTESREFHRQALRLLVVPRAKGGQRRRRVGRGEGERGRRLAAILVKGVERLPSALIREPRPPEPRVPLFEKRQVEHAVLAPRQPLVPLLHQPVSFGRQDVDLFLQHLGDLRGSVVLVQVLSERAWHTHPTGEADGKRRRSIQQRHIQTRTLSHHTSPHLSPE